MNKPLYFPGLNTIRFYAAFSVFMAHLAHMLKLNDPQQPPINRLFLSGSDSVALFFVLSSFLITYLLLQEHHRTGTISLSGFFIRRRLRILPLYYLVVLIALILAPLLFSSARGLIQPTPEVASLLILMLPNIAAYTHNLGIFFPLWTIGVEEQFFSIWAPLVKHSQNIIKLALILIVIKLLLALPIFALRPPIWTHVFIDMRVECFAVGAIAGYLVFHQHRLLKVVYHPGSQVVALTIVAWAALTDPHFGLLGTMIYGMLISAVFAVVILNVSTNPRSVIKLENPAAKSLGQVSYGIYMFHQPAMWLTARVLTDMEATPLYLITVYSGSIFLTFATAFASYHWYEKHFLLLKDKFRPGLSPTNAQVKAAP